MSGLIARIRSALDGTPWMDALPPSVEAFAEARGADAARVPEPALRGLARVIASQPDTAGFLSHRRGFLERLADPSEAALDARAASLAADAESILTLDLEGALDALRLRRREEMAWAACLDLSGTCAFEAVSGYLSLLAESTLEIALDLALRETGGGGDDDDFAVLGMGKLAGRELTYHSDLDLIFLYRGGPDAVTRASRLGQRLISYLTTMTGAGVAYEVDTRLRPSGRQGMLVTSFDAFLQYQLQAAATWEHLAQLRGRVVAGPAEVTAVLDRVHAHILDTRTPPWPELSGMREQVERERGGGDAVAVKTGRGGLMDVDFLAGGGLLERGTDRFPAVPSVPAMLRSCARGPAVETLIDDYGLLRQVEARMRWIAGRPVEVLRKDATAAAVAELVEPGLAADALLLRIADARARIRSAWDAVVKSGSLAALER